MAVTQGRMTRIINSVVATPPDSPKITTSAYGLVVSEILEITQYLLSINRTESIQ